jgi:hypothetical protein
MVKTGGRRWSTLRACGWRSYDDEDGGVRRAGCSMHVLVTCARFIGETIRLRCLVSANGSLTASRQTQRVLTSTQPRTSAPCSAWRH